MPENALPLLTFQPGTLGPIRGRIANDDDSDDGDGRPGNPRRWYHYVPLVIAVLLLLAPHPSILYVLLNYHYLTLHAPHYFIAHLLVIYTLSFLAFSSLIACVARDPGPIPEPKSEEAARGDGDDMSLQDALLAALPPDDYTQPGRWCRVCWRPKPERAHHCSQCGRCILKMDHHCPWMGAKCIGLRTYPSFLHFLASVTLLAAYVAVVCIRGLVFAFSNPLVVRNEMTPVHMILLSFAGCAFTLVLGSFFGYHIYLVLTNQTTLEHISPYHLLRHLPPLPPCRLSSPPMEHQLVYAQRSAVRKAHSRLRLYDVGWRRNAAQVFGMAGPKRRWHAWVARILWGGYCYGTGTQFPRNPHAEEVLDKLAAELVRLEDDRNAD